MRYMQGMVFEVFGPLIGMIFVSFGNAFLA